MGLLSGLHSRGYNTWPPSFLGGSSYHKITIVTKERRVSQVTIRCLERECPLIIYLKCEHCGSMAGSRDGMQIVHLMGLNSRPPAWGSYTWPTPFPLVGPTVFTTSYSDMISQRFVRYSSLVLKKSRTFLVFAVLGGLFIMQDCHGEAVQLSLFFQILHTITSTTLIWKPQELE